MTVRMSSTHVIRPSRGVRSRGWTGPPTHYRLSPASQRTRRAPGAPREPPVPPRRRGTRRLAVALPAVAAVSLGARVGRRPARPSRCPHRRSAHDRPGAAGEVRGAAGLHLHRPARHPRAGLGDQDHLRRLRHQTIGTTRACASGGKSEHKDGRALDWMHDSTDPADKATGGLLPGVAGRPGRPGRGRRQRAPPRRHVRDLEQAVLERLRPHAGVGALHRRQPPHRPHPHLAQLGRRAQADLVLDRHAPRGLRLRTLPGLHRRAGRAGAALHRCRTPGYRPAGVPGRWNADTTADVIATSPTAS